MSYLDIVDSRVQVFDSVLECAIEIYACQGAAVVSDNDPVGVQHGHNFENKVVAQNLCEENEETEESSVEKTNHPYCCLVFFLPSWHASSYSCIGVIAEEKVEKALHHPGGVGLARMDSRGDDNTLLQDGRREQRASAMRQW